MKRSISLLITGVSLVVFCAGLASPLAFAATSPAPGSGQALEIAPPLITLTVDPGKTITTTLQLRDVSKGPLLVSNQINDFVAAGEDGTPKILLDNNDTNNPFSLRGWIQPLPELLLQPNQIKALPVTIRVPANASPGGHYGVIRFTGTAPELKGTGVSLSASLGALVLVTVNGDAKEKLTIEQFSVTKIKKDKSLGEPASLFENTPIGFVERIKNEGNIHEKPVGHIVIKNMFGKAVAGVNVNLPPRNILPDSTRKFTQTLDESVIGSKRLFGHFTATITLTYGKNQTVTSKLGFWIIPYKLILGIIILLVVGFFALRTFIRNYNKRIISKAQGQKRHTKRK